MFKARQRGNRTQNPISDMEQFYLNQYYQTQSMNPSPNLGPTVPPGAYQSNHRLPPSAFASLDQLEQRINRIEQYLGLSTKSSFHTIKR